jgi:hypothetical protein
MLLALGGGGGDIASAHCVGAQLVRHVTAAVACAVEVVGGVITGDWAMSTPPWLLNMLMQPKDQQDP